MVFDVSIAQQAPHRPACYGTDRIRNDAGRDSQVSELRCGCFIRRAAMSILRLTTSNGRVSFVFRVDVQRQQALPALRRRGRASRSYGLAAAEVSPVSGRNAVAVDWSDSRT